VFNEDSGFANRGTFLVDRGGVVRFAECKQPGEPRDQKVWAEALRALQPG
jgi:peroxiredoxin (alkyl hydroperoxide reductase subunit C)